MRGFAIALLVALIGAGLGGSLAQGAHTVPEAKRRTTIPVPSDGNAAAVHLVTTATPKKGTKPKRLSKRPKLKVLKAPKGVVVAASHKRDKKNKNRWHTTVTVTNRAGPAATRAAAGPADAEQDGVIIVELVQTDTAFVMSITVVQIEQDVTNADTPLMPWVAPYCDPTGSSGYVVLVGPLPAGVSVQEFIEYLCTLAMDGKAEFDAYEELGLAGLVFDLDPYPGNMMEAYLRFKGVNIPPFNGASFRFPGRMVTAQLPPAGFGGVITSERVTWGSMNVPFQPGQEYRANVRLNNAFMPDQRYYGSFTTTGGPPYSVEYPGYYTP